MPTEPQLSVILTTYERPAHLERCLHCLTLQQGMDGKFEVIVADDGSQDNTEQIVRSVTRTASFPVKWVTHPHRGFRAALCRNDGVRASSAPYLLFVDCDCLFPRDHLQKHFLARRSGVVRAGHCLRLSQAATEQIDTRAIETEEYRNWICREERNRFRQQKIKNHYYQLIRHSTKPKLIAYDFGIAREDFEAVNGFDEAFIGWGCEDDDLAYRLRRAGRRIQSALEYTHGYHMWHPTEPSRPALWKLGTNVLRMFAPQRPIQCSSGLVFIGDESTEASPASSTSFLNGSSSPARSAA
jgi:glycosyltransferase involved in cell wall biosynthesis